MVSSNVSFSKGYITEIGEGASGVISHAYRAPKRLKDS